MLSQVATRFGRDGVLLIDRLIADEVAIELGRLIDPLLETADRRRPGLRRALCLEPRLAGILAEPAVNALLDTLAGPSFRCVRALIFDKSPQTNWMVPWHQDATIALKERAELDGFGPWAIKDGEHHCQPPMKILESIVVLRLALDDCPAEAGALRVVRGSHKHGLLTGEMLRSMVDSSEVIEGVTPRGGAVLMRPLSVHSSARAEDWPHRRRVLHLECTSAALPPPLQWAECS